MTIIRNMPPSDDGEHILLLSQVEHARIAGEIAAVWGGPNVEPLVPCREIVDAVCHHDDGWMDWELRPKVDPTTGRPYPFTGMPSNEKLDIWRESIAAAQALGPLQGAIAAWHFMGLEQGTNRWQATQAHTDSAADEFIDQYSALADEWLGEWSRESPENTAQVARRACAWLQWFDLLSLWLCMAERRKPERFETRGGDKIVMQPQAAERISTRILVTPWPFNVTGLQLEITGLQVPNRHYRDAADLADEGGTPTRLRWNLVPN